MNELYTGALLYTDGIKTLATSEGSLQGQAALLKNFAQRNFLKLNLNKCKMVLFLRG